MTNIYSYIIDIYSYITNNYNYDDYPNYIYVYYDCEDREVEYEKYNNNLTEIYYKLTEEEEIEYKNMDTNEINTVWRYLVLEMEDNDIKSDYKIGEFNKERVSDNDFYEKRETVYIYNNNEESADAQVATQ